MKRILAVILCVCLFCACGCAADGPNITVITKGSVSHSLHTTTTAPPTATTVYTGGSASGTAGTGTTATRPSIVAENGSNEVGNRIAQTAVSLIGTPFKAGAGGPDAFDNPGFVVYCYKQEGYTVPNRAAKMTEFGAAVSLDALQPGDILLFCNEIGGEAQFVGIYIGGDQFVACNNPESPTKAQQLSSKYWAERLLAARRAS